MCAAGETNSTGEIEITSEMIDAGVLALDDSDYGRDPTATAEGAVMDVLRAALAAGGRYRNKQPDNSPC